MPNQNNLGCFVGIWSFVMSQTIRFVAFKWPGVLSRGFTVSQPPIIGFGSRGLWFLEYLQASGDIFDRMLTRKSLIFVTISNMTSLVGKGEEGIVFGAASEAAQLFSAPRVFLMQLSEGSCTWREGIQPCTRTQTPARKGFALGDVLLGLPTESWNGLGLKGP